MSDPLAIITSKLQKLRSERELCDSEINSLMHEKESILKIIPKVLEELKNMKEGIDAKQAEVDTFDRAIMEIEKQYGSTIFTSRFFTSNKD